MFWICCKLNVKTTTCVNKMIAMKRIILSILTMLCPFIVATAQSYDEMVREILDYQKCFDKNSHGLQDDSYDTDGRTVNYKAAVNFQTANFFLSDTEYETEGLPSIESVHNWLRTEDNSFHIVAHGILPNGGGSTKEIEIGGQYLKAEQVAGLILKHLRKYELLLSLKKQPFSIVLHSCKAGYGENSFAAQLSRCLEDKIRGLTVIAADDIVWLDNRSNSLYPSEKICSTRAQEQDSAYPGKDWLVFKNGVRMMRGGKTCQETIRMAQERLMPILMKEPDFVN